MGKQDAPDIFVSGLDHVELTGNGLARFVMFANAPDDDGTDTRHYLNIVMPVSEVPDAIRKSMVIDETDGTIRRVFPQWLH